MAAPLEVVRYAFDESLTLACVVMPDRRLAGERRERFLFLNHVERALYGETSSGAVHRLLARASLATCTLPLKRASIAQGYVTEAEYAQLIAELESSLDFTAQGRVRGCTLIPVANAVQAAHTLGRCDRVLKFHAALNAPLPRLWELEAEREANEANGELDLVLEDLIDEAAEFEQPLHAELLHTMVPFEETAEETETMQRVWKLERIAPSLEKQFADYKDWRLSPLNYQRQGNAVVDTTAAADRGTMLRFLAFCHDVHGFAATTLDVLGSAELATMAQAWLEALVERGLMWSTCANYVNSICNVTAWWWDGDYTVEEAAMEMDPQPTDLLLRLRAQCENQSRQQQLYAKKPANWLDWDKAQEARVKCAEAWSKAGSLAHDAKVSLLKEYLVLLFHTVMPPDRVGIIRKLRWGYTLKKDAPGAYRLDMTVARFKNARFYGPSVTSVSALIAPALDAYINLIAFDFDDQPYVFCTARDPLRCQTSSQWSAYCKKIFQRWSGVACPPKMLRASFVTFIRNSEASPEILKQAARAMRHQKETADSDKYDKESNDRLVSAAVAYCEAHARRFMPTAPSGAAPAADDWVLVPGQRLNYKAKATGPAVDGQRPFSVQIEWLAAFELSMTLRFPVCPGRVDGLLFRLPSDESLVGKTMAVATTLDAAAVKTASITLTALQMQVLAVGGEAGGGGGGGSNGGGNGGEGGGGADGDGGASRRPPIQSVQRQPIPIAEAHTRLAALSYALGDAAPEGDCYPLSVLASVGEITPAEAVQPSASTIAKVVTTRTAAIDLIVGESIGGIDGAVFRAGEGLPADVGEAEAAMAAWRAAGHWSDGLPFKTPPFMHGVAVVVKRPVIVLERRGDAYLNPVHVYGAIDPQGNLVRTPARGGDPETIPSYRHIEFETVLAAMRSPTPPALIAFDGVNHHSPFLRAELAPTEVVDPKDVGNLDDLDDAVPLEEVPYAAENIVVPPGGESHVSHVDQQLQVAEQLQEPGAHQMLVGELTDEEMNATMQRLELTWKDEKQTIMIGSVKTHAQIGEVEIFLDARLKVDAMTVIVPGVRRFDFTRSEFGQRLLSCMTSPDPPAMGDDDEMGAMGGDDPDGMDEAAVHETPPELRPVLPMAPDRPTNIARAKSLGGAAAEAVETLAEAAPVQLEPPAVVGAVPLVAAAAPAVTTATPVAAAVAAVAAQPVAAVAELAVAVATPAPQKKRRGAAKRALQAMGEQGDDDDPDSRHEVKVPKHHRPPPKELSLTDALSGPFSTLSPITTAPEWLGNALQPESATAAQLVGKYVCFNWQDWGFAVGKLGAPTADDANFGVTYPQWGAEQQTLTLEAYGVDGGAGSWVLLNGSLAPIQTYVNGKYQVCGQWYRAAQLPFYGDALRAARDAVRNVKQLESQQAAEEELETGGHAIGARVFARGLGGDGEVAWFIAEVVGHRHKYPPLQVKFLATSDGDTSALALPLPRMSFVPATHVQVDEPQ